MTATDDSLRQLMRASQGGDKRAYGQLLEQSQTWLRRYFARRIPPAMLDDLVQDTLISLHRKRATYDPERAFLPWLAAIARYRWIDQLRKVYRHAESQLEDNMAVEPEADRLATQMTIDALLMRIPESQAEVIRLVKITGLSIVEAAQRTGQSESLVKVNIHRGIKRMHAMIEES